MSSLRRRLLLGIGLGVGAILVLAGLFVYRLERTAMYDELDRAIAARTRGLAALVEQEPGGIENDIGRSHLPEFSRAERPQYFTLWYRDGRVLDRAESLRGGALVPAPGADETLVTEAVTLPDGAAGRQATLRFTPRPDPDDDVHAPPPVPERLVLAFAQDTRDVEASLAQLRSVLLLAGALALLLVLAVLVAVVKLGLRPVTGLARQIRAIDPRAPQPGFTAPALPAELAPIAARLDELMRGLAAAFARERELTAELAHELRTPITGLKVTLELALSREREASEYRGAMRECLAICEQTQRMVDALLTLTRLDAGLVQPARAVVDLTALLEATLPAFERRAEQRGLAVARALEPGVELPTDADLLGLVLNNLLDNAIRHADAGGALRVALTRTPGAAALRIANTGSRLDQAQAQQATSRFWRGDSARGSGLHAGLGLSLCLELVALLGGTLRLDAEPGGWFTATVTLPDPSYAGAT